MKLLQFIKFCVVGASNTVIYYAVYLLLTSLKLHYVTANAVGFIVSVTNSFYWNNKYVFTKRLGERRSLFRTYIKALLSYAVTGLLLANLLLLLWIEFFGISEKLAPILNLIFTIPLNFILNKLWAFRNRG